MITFGLSVHSPVTTDYIGQYQVRGNFVQTNFHHWPRHWALETTDPARAGDIVISVKFKSNSRHKNWFLNFNNNFQLIHYSKQCIFTVSWRTKYIFKLSSLNVSLYLFTDWVVLEGIIRTFQLFEYLRPNSDIRYSCWMPLQNRNIFSIWSCKLCSLTGTWKGSKTPLLFPASGPSWVEGGGAETEAKQTRQWPQRLGGAGPGHNMVTMLQGKTKHTITRYKHNENAFSVILELVFQSIGIKPWFNWKILLWYSHKILPLTCKRPL